MKRDPFERDRPGFAAVWRVTLWLIIGALISAALCVFIVFLFLELTT